MAQPGSAPVLGTGGRKFESCLPDSYLNKSPVLKKSQSKDWGFFVFFGGLGIVEVATIFVLDEELRKVDSN